MAVLHRNGSVPADPCATVPRQDPAGPSAISPPRRVPRTRTGAAWLGICTAAAAFVVLIVFMLQNTRSVEVTFLWMHGSVPLALALLVAGVGVAILAMAVGVARIGQLRRLARRHQ
ncbi:MAG TPA: lipopolysaccharide assembly protein LapA domain-containing protein [Jiangellales bacterium]|nr:lipopolysaccharide assembly protein LapA domain-containing protein [Jiangellales bacterium]